MTITLTDYGRFTIEQDPENLHVWMSPGDVVAVLPFDDKNAYFARQDRSPIGGKATALCAGMIDDGEWPARAARRELKEEYGFDAGLLWLVDTFYSSEGITDEKTYLFLATDLTKGEPTDPDEAVEVLPANLDRLLDYLPMLNTAKAKIALFHLYKHLRVGL